MRHSVNNTAQAADILMHKWPVEPGRKHLAARLACLAVLEGKAAPERARKAFEAAADEAEILAR